MFGKTTFPILTAAAAAVALAGPAYAGVSGPAFWIDGELYRTVATPTDLSGTGAPASTYDAIYSFGGAQRNVAEAKPGDRDFNGGRWAVHQLAFPNGYAAALAAGDANGNGSIDSTAELELAFADGSAVDTGTILRMFVCTVNRVPANG
ncbi:MAG TPA: hypothetical protein VLI04_03290 [Nocardioidaceae bacterium]|nr:hypothetical protein [Nocardioidaceae bacterium]